MIFTAYVLYSLRLFKLKTEGQATKTENLTEKNVKLKSKFSIMLGQLWILKSEESENGFCVSLLSRSIQDLSDHGASKEPKNPCPELVLRFVDAPSFDAKCVFGFSWIFLKKRLLNQNLTSPAQKRNMLLRRSDSTSSIPNVHDTCIYLPGQ